MKFKKFSLIFLFHFFFISLLGAQEINIKWGKDYQFPKRTYIKKIIGGDESGFYVLKSQGERGNKEGEMILEKYLSDNITLITSSRLSVPKIKGENVRYEQILLLNGNLILFTSYYDKAEGTNAVYAQFIDHTGKNISDVKQLNKFSAQQKKNTGNFEVVLSQDSSMILLCSSEPFEKYANEKLSYKVFDGNLNHIWSTELELPYSGKELKISNHILDSYGNVHMLAKVVRNEKGEKGQANYYFTILSYIYKEDAVKEYELSLRDKSISDIAFKLSNTGDLIAAGFYSNTTRGQQSTNTQFGFNVMATQEQKSLVAGTFFMKIDQRTQKVISRGIKEFDKTFLSEFMSTKNIEKGKELYSYLIDHLIIREDGGVILVGEQYFSSMICNYDPRTGIRNCNYHYYYNDIVVVNINPDGSIDWARKIPKKQHSVNDRGFYSSYICVYDTDKLFLLFNDNPKNIGLKEERKMRYMNNPLKAIVMLASIDDKGVMTRSPLFSAKDQKVIVRPKIFRQTGSNTAIVYGQKRKTYKMGRMNFTSQTPVISTN
jgi:hypothetical protein